VVGWFLATCRPLVQLVDLRQRGGDRSGGPGGVRRCVIGHDLHPAAPRLQASFGLLPRRGLPITASIDEQ